MGTEKTVTRTLVVGILVVTAGTACSSIDGLNSESSALSGTAGTLVSAIASKCLDDSYSQTTDGNPIQLYSCNNTGAQNWTYTNGTFVGLGGKCLDIKSNNQISGTAVQLYQCNGTDAQKWIVDGKAIKSTQGLCLDVKASNSDDGTPIQLYGCNGNPSQQWTFSGGTGGGGSTSVGTSSGQGGTGGETSGSGTSSGGAVTSACSTASPTYYVAAGGNDSNEGTSLASAFLTVNAAIGAAHPGDIIQIEPGTYAGFSIWNGTGDTARAAGSASKHFTIRGDAAYSRGSMILGSSWIWGNYWDICHLRITTSNPSTSKSDGLAGGYGTGDWAMTSHIHVDDLEIDHNWASGFRAYAPSSNITISNSYVHDNCLENVNGVSKSDGAPWDNGISLTDTTDSLVENNLVERIWGEGIDIIGRTVISPMNNIVRGNTIHNSYSVMMYNDHAPSNVWTGNFGYNDDPSFYRDGKPTTGVLIADEAAPNGGPGSSGVVISNNIIYGGLVGFQYGAFNLGLGMHNVSVYGNTFVNSVLSGIQIDNVPSTSGNVIENNIFLSSTGVAANVSNPAGLTFLRNAWSGKTSGMQTGSGDVTADPLLVGEKGWSAAYSATASYVPASSSPVHGAGQFVSGMTSDFLGATRPTPPSMGAIEPPN